MNRLVKKLLGIKEPADNGQIRRIEKEQDHIEKELRRLQAEVALTRLRRRKEQGA